MRILQVYTGVLSVVCFLLFAFRFFGAFALPCPAPPRPAPPRPAPPRPALPRPAPPRVALPAS